MRNNYNYNNWLLLLLVALTITTSTTTYAQTSTQAPQEEVDTLAVEKNVEESTMTCPETIVDRRNGPIRVAFLLPEGQEGFQFTAGSAYRDIDGTCYQITWNNFAFLCDTDTGKYVQTSGNFQLTNHAETILQPDDCVNGQGNVVNGLQDYLLARIDMPTECFATNVDWEYEPLFARLSLPERTGNWTFEQGYASSFSNNTCFRMEWSTLVFTCDIMSREWTLTSGNQTTSQLSADQVQGACMTTTSGNPNEQIQVVDTSTADACPAWTLAENNGPLQVEMTLPGNYTRGSIVEYPPDQVSRVINGQCYQLSWTYHQFSCDVFAGKWRQTSSGIFTTPNSPPDTASCESNTPTTPYLKVSETVPPQAPSAAPTIVKVALGDQESSSAAPSPAPTFPQIALGNAPSAAPSMDGTYEPTIRLTGGVAVTSSSAAPSMRPTPYLRSQAPTAQTTTTTTTTTTTDPPVSTSSYANSDTYCGCKSCTPEIWNNVTAEFTCGQRITFVANGANATMQGACRLIGGFEWPQVCGACNPDTCVADEDNLPTIDDSTEASSTMGPTDSIENVEFTNMPSAAPPSVIPFVVESDGSKDSKDSGSRDSASAQGTEDEFLPDDITETLVEEADADLKEEEDADISLVVGNSAAAKTYGVQWRMSWTAVFFVAGKLLW